VRVFQVSPIVGTVAAVAYPAGELFETITKFASSDALATCRSYNPKIQSKYGKENSSEKTDYPERLMELSFAYAPPLIISAAAGNKVFDALENGAKTAEEVAKKTGASPRALRILMNALVGLDLLKKGSTGAIFAHTRKRCISYQQEARNPRGVLWHDLRHSLFPDG
jgi:hypothetical protein